MSTFVTLGDQGVTEPGEVVESITLRDGSVEGTKVWKVSGLAPCAGSRCNETRLLTASDGRLRPSGRRSSFKGSRITIHASAVEADSEWVRKRVLVLEGISSL